MGFGLGLRAFGAAVSWDLRCRLLERVRLPDLLPGVSLHRSDVAATVAFPAQLVTLSHGFQDIATGCPQFLDPRLVQDAQRPGPASWVYLPVLARGRAVGTQPALDKAIENLLFGSFEA